MFYIIKLQLTLPTYNVNISCQQPSDRAYFMCLVSGSYIQYILVSLLNYPHVHFWKWNKDKEVWQSDVKHWPSSHSKQGIRQFGSEREESASLCHPTGSIHVLLTQEWMTTVNNSKVCPLSSLAIRHEYRGHDASWGAEADMDPLQGCYWALTSKTQDQGPHSQKDFEWFDWKILIGVNILQMLTLKLICRASRA